MKSRRDFLTGLSGIGLAAAFRGDAIARAAGAGKDAAQTPPHELAARKTTGRRSSGPSTSTGPGSTSTTAASPRARPTCSTR